MFSPTVTIATSKMPDLGERRDSRDIRLARGHDVPEARDDEGGLIEVLGALVGEEDAQRRGRPLVHAATSLSNW